jgi:hypothetical protein
MVDAMGWQLIQSRKQNDNSNDDSKCNHDDGLSLHSILIYNLLELEDYQNLYCVV